LKKIKSNNPYFDRSELQINMKCVKEIEDEDFADHNGVQVFLGGAGTGN